jgi:dolichol-phosphate mannosyltransferase
MRSQPDLTVVIPTYNERDRIETIVDEVLASCATCRIAAEVIVVDDNSPDGTGARVDEMGRTRAVRVIHRPGKLGLGSAVLDGFAAATADVVAAIDADLSHPPRLLPVLYEILKERDADLVVASRYVPGGGTKDWSFGRLLLSRAGCFAARPLTPVHDPMSGFFVVRRERALSMRTSLRGFKIGLELLVKAGARSVVEIGYVFVGRDAGGSTMSVGEALRFARQLLDLYRFTFLEARQRPRHQVVASDHRSTPSRETHVNARA